MYNIFKNSTNCQSRFPILHCDLITKINYTYLSHYLDNIALSREQTTPVDPLNANKINW